jgi:hypothetical protein
LHSGARNHTAYQRAGISTIGDKVVEAAANRSVGGFASQPAGYATHIYQLALSYMEGSPFAPSFDCSIDRLDLPSIYFLLLSV